MIGDSAPGGKVEYRRALAASFLFKYYVHVACLLEADSQVRLKRELQASYKHKEVCQFWDNLSILHWNQCSATCPG